MARHAGADEAEAVPVVEPSVQRGLLAGAWPEAEGSEKDGAAASVAAFFGVNHRPMLGARYRTLGFFLSSAHSLKQEA